MTLPMYLGDPLHPNTKGTGGELTDSFLNSFTDSAGTTSEYSLYASHIQTDKPIGILVHLHGDGGYEATNQPDDWYMTSPEGILTLARERNYILLVPVSPTKDAGGKLRWWIKMNTSSPWVVELIKDKVLSKFDVDTTKFWFSGFSGGAEALTYSIVPDYLDELPITEGGAVIMGGGGANTTYSHPGITDGPRGTFSLTWVVGENDDGSTDDDTSFDAVSASAKGERYYRTHFWNTERIEVPNMVHLLHEDGKGIYGRFIKHAMDRGQTMQRHDPGPVKAIYYGRDLIRAIYYNARLLWFGR